MTTWGDIYWKWVRKGADRADAAYRADQWERKHTLSVKHTDQESAAVAVAPRVALADIEGSIKARYDFTADKAVEGCPAVDELKLLSICLLVVQNGFVVVGKSAPASPANFNADLGRKLAYEDAIRQLWPLMGFSLRDRLAAA